MERTRDLRYQFPLVRGEDVRAVQQALIAARATPPCGVADGLYGDATSRSVSGFQAGAGLDPSGIVDAATWAALFRAAGTAASVPLRGANEALPPPASAPVAAPPPAPAGPAPTSATPPPLSRVQAGRVKAWLMGNFTTQITSAIAGTPIDDNMVCAIACKETAPMWLGWTDKLSPADLLARCVFDASGDAEGTSRSAFPQNTAEFRARYPDLADMLIEEANRSRVLRNLGRAAWVYKGYGIFQYDLQHITTDEAFFRQRQWGDFDACIERLMREMRRTLGVSGGDLRGAVRRYNGSGARAEEYADHVMLMRFWLASV